jgi:hypothetical protein
MDTPGDARLENGVPDHRSLGEIKVEAFDQDVAVNDRHQAFSAELLRLALLGVGGVGYVTSRSLPSAQAGQTALSVSGSAKWLVLIAAASFGFAAAFALALRYISSDLLAFQLRILRLRIRSNPTDVRDADQEEVRRNWRLKATRPMLVLASTFLVVGAGVFIAFLFSVLRP